MKKKENKKQKKIVNKKEKKKNIIKEVEEKEFVSEIKEENNKVSRKELIIVTTIFTTLIVILLVLHKFNYDLTNFKELDEKFSLVTSQKKIEEEFIIKGYDIEDPNVILNPYGNSPLTALILFETKKDVRPKVTIKGKDELTTYTHTFKKGKEHYLAIYGLYPDTKNEVIIKYGNVEKTIYIETEKLPDDFVLPTDVYLNDEYKEELEDNLYFYTPSSRGYTCAYDTNGDVRWYLSNYALWEINRLENGHMLVSTERLINSPYYMTGLYEIDLLGKIYNEYSLEGGYHHDYYEMPNGNLLIASNNFYNDDGTVEDYIVEIDRKSGEIVKTFDLKNVLKMDDGKSENWTAYDWFHNNSVWYDEKTNSITLSGRHQDAVINISYETGELNWIIGDPTSWSKKYQKYFFKPINEEEFEWQWSQHAAMITPEGYVFILDNGNNKSKEKDEYVSANDSYTRGVMYKIDTKKMTIEQIWEYGKERGSEFYSPYISDVDYLNKNHYIVHSGGIVYVDGENSNQPAGISGYDSLVSDTVEILNDEVIFELILPTNNYRVEKMSLYIGEDFTIGEAKRLGTLGKTEVTDKKIGFLNNVIEIDKKYKEYNINFINEEDRLIFSGKFKKGTKVNLILYKNLSSNIYNVSVSKKPYTALCVDIMTEEETKNGLNITKYINKVGLKGYYSIYVEINDKLYDTNYFINL